MAIALISLDLDDTLWDAAPVLERAERAQYAWLAEHCPRITGRHSIEELYRMRVEYAAANPALRHSFTLIRHGFYAGLLAANGYDPRAADELMRYFLGVRSQVQPFDDVAPALAALRRNFALAAMTNGNTDLAHAGLAAWFDYVVTPEQTGAAKPDARMFRHLFAQARVAPRQVVHVGDQPLHDVDGARQAGAWAVWINRKGAAWPAGQAAAHAEIGSLAQLLPAIRRLQSTSTE